MSFAVHTRHTFQCSGRWVQFLDFINSRFLYRYLQTIKIKNKIGKKGAHIFCEVLFFSDQGGHYAPCSGTAGLLLLAGISKSCDSLKLSFQFYFPALALRGRVFLDVNSKMAMLSKLGAFSFQVKPFRLL